MHIPSYIFGIFTAILIVAAWQMASRAITRRRSAPDFRADVYTNSTDSKYPRDAVSRGRFQEQLEALQHIRRLRDSRKAREDAILAGGLEMRRVIRAARASENASSH